MRQHDMARQALERALQMEAMLVKPRQRLVEPDLSNSWSSDESPRHRPSQHSHSHRQRMPQIHIHNHLSTSSEQPQTKQQLQVPSKADLLYNTSYVYNTYDHYDTTDGQHLQQAAPRKQLETLKNCVDMSGLSLSVRAFSHLLLLALLLLTIASEDS